MTACIRVIEMGNTYETDVEGFCDNTIMDYTKGLEIIDSMYVSGEPYSIEDDFPQKYEIIKRNEILPQIAKIASNN